jgi:hypothetical protein
MERNRQRWRSKKEKLDERLDQLLNADTNSLKKLQRELRTSLQQPPAPLFLVQRGKEVIEKTTNSLETIKRQQKKEDGKQAIENALGQLKIIKQLFENLERLNLYKDLSQAALGKLSEEDIINQAEAVGNSLENSEKTTVDGLVRHLKAVEQLLKEQNDLNAYSKLVPSVVVRLGNTVITTLESLSSLKERSMPRCLAPR